ncbi:MAG: hypothetical protein AAF567_12210 [Actinomycetota bacterium]
MKVHERVFAIWFGLALLVALAGCAGSSESTPPEFADGPAAPAPAVPAVATPTVEPTEVEEADPVDRPSDEERIDAAVAALEAEGAGDLIAWDVLESAVSDDGTVTLSLCGWTGEDVFDDVYRSQWQTTGAAGDVEASHLGTILDAGECLNTQLVESALDFIDEYEVFWAEMLRYPERYAEDLRASQLLTPTRNEDGLAFAADRVADGLYVDYAPLDGNLRRAAVAPVLLRRFVADDGTQLAEIVICRELDPRYGIYSTNGEIFDDVKPETVGPHDVSAYRILRAPTEDAWLYAESDLLAWADCFGHGEGWSTGVGAWLEQHPDTYVEVAE